MTYAAEVIIMSLVAMRLVRRKSVTTVVLKRQHFRVTLLFENLQKCFRDLRFCGAVSELTNLGQKIANQFGATPLQGMDELLPHTVRG